MEFEASPVVPAGGLPAWNVPDGTIPPATNLAAGVPVRRGEVRGAWAHVTAANGWTGWVDAARLAEPVAPPPPPPPPSPGAAPPPAVPAPLAAPAAPATAPAAPAAPAPPVAVAPVPRKADAVTIAGVVWPLASIGQRAAARAIDTFFVAAALFVVVFTVAGFAPDLFDGEDAGFALAFGAAVILGVVTGIAYEVTFVARKGGTPGKLMLGVRVADAHSGAHPTWGRSLLRWAVPFGFLAVIPYVGILGAILVYASASWDDLQRGWHDKAADTAVLKTR